MKNIHNNPLFTDLTPEEEVSVQGGNPLVIAALRAAVKLGKPAVQIAIQKFKSWFADSDNGLIFWDKKGTKDDGIRAGAGIRNDVDVPGSDKFGIKNNGKWYSV